MPKAAVGSFIGWMADSNSSIKSLWELVACMCGRWLTQWQAVIVGSGSIPTCGLFSTLFHFLLALISIKRVLIVLNKI